MTVTREQDGPDITDHLWHEIVHLDCTWCVPGHVRDRLEAAHAARGRAADEADHALTGGAVLTLALAWSLLVAGIATAVLAPPATGWHGLAVLLAAGGGGLMWRCLTVAGRRHDRSTTESLLEGDDR